MRITVLCGGVGAARLLCGFKSLLDEIDDLFITAVINTGDDDTFYGVHVSPDIDTIMYHLSDLHDDQRGWGRKDDTFNFVESLRSQGHNAWFNLGDSDMGLCYFRTLLLENSLNLGEATDVISNNLGVHKRINLLPATNSEAKTRIVTDMGELSFQEYFVREQCRPKIVDIKYGAQVHDDGTLKKLFDETDKIIIAPSNPFLSIKPILEIKNVHESLQTHKSKTIAVSPIVSGQAIKGPLAQIMENFSMEVSPVSIAEIYKDLVDTFVLDIQDQELANDISTMNLQPIVLDTIMDSDTKRKDLAKKLMDITL